MTMSARTDGIPVIDIHDPDLLKDPYHGYSRIREQAPVVRAVRPGIEAWLVTRYEDVKAVLRDTRFVMDPRRVPGLDVENLTANVVVGAAGLPPEFMKYWTSGLQDFDGDEHSRLRDLVSQAFTVRRVTELRPRVVEIVDGLLDRLPEHTDSDGVVDLLWHFAYQVSGTVLCELLGIPEEDRDKWKAWRRTLGRQDGLSKAETWHQITEYIELELVPRHRAEQPDDLVTDLVRAHDDGRLTEPELTTLLFSIGLTTQQSAQLTGNGTLALLTNPDQLALLRSRPDLVPRAVHELLRFCGPAIAPTRPRYATEDVEVGGQLIRTGDALWVVLASANWDPRRFDEADRLDITREARREAHLAFGSGPHYCLGAAMARQEAGVVFARLPYRFPNLRLAVDPDTLEREPIHGHYRLKSLPVRL